MSGIMARTPKAAAQWGPKLHIAFGQGNTWQVGAARAVHLSMNRRSNLFAGWFPSRRTRRLRSKFPGMGQRARPTLRDKRKASAAGWHPTRCKRWLLGRPKGWRPKAAKGIWRLGAFLFCRTAVPSERGPALLFSKAGLFYDNTYVGRGDLFTWVNFEGLG